MELFKCKHCGAPYAYRENLELHEKSCPKRSAAQPVSRYILPVELQREWIENRKHYHPREWIAGLRLVDEHIDWFGFKVGKMHEVEPIDLAGAIGDVHYHANPPEPPFTSYPDRFNWVTAVGKKEIPPTLNALFMTAYQDDSVLWYILPKYREVEESWRIEVKSPEIPTKVRNLERLGYDRWQCVALDIFHDLYRRGRIRWGHFRLGERDQVWNVKDDMVPS